MGLVARGDSYESVRGEEAEAPKAAAGAPGGDVAVAGDRSVPASLTLRAPGLRDMESRHGLFDMDRLLAERLALTVQLAPLEAIVGPGGVGEAQTKSLRAALAAEFRQSAAESGTKVTEAAIEERAHADPRYSAKLEEMAGMRAEYVCLRGMIDQLTSQMQYAQASLRLLATEPRG
jgi:hypothetical protein